MTKNLQDTPFGARMRMAFAGASDSEITRKLGRKSPSDVGKWTKRGVLPPSDVLIEIARLTQCNLHWLLTGQGEADTDPLRFLPASTREVVLKFSDDRGLEPMVVELVEEALLRRASEMLANRRLLSARQIDQLLAIVNALSLSDEETPAAARRRPAS